MSILGTAEYLEQEGYDAETILAILVDRMRREESDRDADTSAECERMTRLTNELVACGVSDPFAGGQP